MKSFIIFLMKNLNEMGIQIPEILLPKNLDVSTWAVVACDQYTQDREYWHSVEKIAGTKPSSLNLILPEVYLNDADKALRIEKIREQMGAYLNDGVFANAEQEAIYVERKTAYGRTRHGLVCAIDLETYEWKPFSKALIRATEATIVDRIPPRMEIRRGAPLELPHIMLLVNDPAHSLVEGLGERVKAASPVYTGDLMMKSGSITGWAVKSAEDLEYLRATVEALAAKNTAPDGSTFLFAVGDGNHSLATAKAVWDEYKAVHPEDTTNSARYALVEIVNIYDTGLTFEPIHRVVFNADVAQMTATLAEKLGGTLESMATAQELENAVKGSAADFGFTFTQNGTQKYMLLRTSITELAVSRLQPELDEFLKNSTGKPEIDYIHGAQEVFRLGAKDGATGILLPPVAKDSFFATINGRGPLPRKSFSMGEADEKRFYLECRRLFK